MAADERERKRRAAVAGAYKSDWQKKRREGAKERLLARQRAEFWVQKSAPKNQREFSRRNI